jgi:hypothetical protein
MPWSREPPTPKLVGKSFARYTRNLLVHKLLLMSYVFNRILKFALTLWIPGSPGLIGVRQPA